MYFPKFPRLLGNVIAWLAKFLSCGNKNIAGKICAENGQRANYNRTVDTASQSWFTLGRDRLACSNVAVDRQTP